MATFLLGHGAPSPVPAAAMGAPSRLPGEKVGGRGRKPRNLKVGKITVSEKWLEPLARRISNANELKFLDEFLLNKVGPGASTGRGAGGGWGPTGFQPARPPADE